MRALWIELRRSAALWSGVLLLGTVLVLTYAFSGPWGKGPDAWTEEWTNLARWLRFHLMLVWPLALAVGAWQGRRAHRSKMDELLGSVPRPAAQRVLPVALAMCVGLAAAYLVLFLAGAVQVVGNTTFNDFGWVPILVVGFLALFAAALLGMGIGRVLPFLLTAPVLGIAGLAAMVLTSIGSPGTGSILDGAVSQQVALLGPAFEGVRDTFDTIAAHVSVLQMVWFGALILTGFGLFAFDGLKARLLALLPTVVGAAIVLPLLPSEPDEVVVRDAEAVALVCAEGTPRVCVSRLHEDELDSVVEPGRAALADLARLPGDQPAAVIESMRSWLTTGPREPIPAGTVAAQLDDPEFILDRRRNLLAGPVRGCTTWSGEPAEAARRAVIASWFDGRLETVARRPMHPEVAMLAEPMWQSLQALPRDQQAAQVAELRAQGLKC
jgi:hypothetical protein